MKCTHHHKRNGKFKGPHGNIVIPKQRLCYHNYTARYNKPAEKLIGQALNFGRYRTSQGLASRHLTVPSIVLPRPLLWHRSTIMKASTLDKTQNSNYLLKQKQCRT